MLSQQLTDLLKEVEGTGVSSTRFGNKPIFWKNAKGCKVFDVENNEYIDCTSSYGVMGLGYSHPAVIKAISETAHQLIHTMCEIYPTSYYAIALDKIRTSIGRPNDQVILTTSGSDAVDVALKLAYRFSKKKGIIAFNNSFHGQTLNALNVTGQEAFRAPFQDLLPSNVVFTDYPNIYRNAYGSSERLLDETRKCIESIISKYSLTDNSIGAIIVEPMQNAAGYIIPPYGFLSLIREICTKHGIVMIDDEIFTGFGRCGSWLMSDYEHVSSDIVCVGKVMTGGMPAAACVASKGIMAALDYSGMVPLHGSTFTGNALACSAISATIEALKRERLVEKSAVEGNSFRESLREIIGELNEVGDIRGVGTATIIEFVYDRKEKKRNPEAAKRFANYLLDKHIISLLSGLPYGNCVAFCLPFVMDAFDRDQVLRACREYAMQTSDK